MAETPHPFDLSKLVYCPYGHPRLMFGRFEFDEFQGPLVAEIYNGPHAEEFAMRIFQSWHACRDMKGPMKEVAELKARRDELLAALKFSTSVIRSQGMFDLSERMAVDQAEVAIARAEGRIA